MRGGHSEWQTKFFAPSSLWVLIKKTSFRMILPFFERRKTIYFNLLPLVSYFARPRLTKTFETLKTANIEHSLYAVKVVKIIFHSLRQTNPSAKGWKFRNSLEIRLRRRFLYARFVVSPVKTFVAWIYFAFVARLPYYGRYSKNTQLHLRNLSTRRQRKRRLYASRFRVSLYCR